MEGRSPRTVSQPSHLRHTIRVRSSLLLATHAPFLTRPTHICAGRVQNRGHVPERVHLRRRLLHSCSRAAARTRPPCTPALLRWQAALSSRTGREGAREVAFSSV